MPYRRDASQRSYRHYLIISTAFRLPVQRDVRTVRASSGESPTVTTAPWDSSPSTAASGTAAPHTESSAPGTKSTSPHESLSALVSDTALSRAYVSMCRINDGTTPELATPLTSEPNAVHSTRYVNNTDGCARQEVLRDDIPVPPFSFNFPTVLRLRDACRYDQRPINWIPDREISVTGSGRR